MLKGTKINGTFYFEFFNIKISVDNYCVYDYN